MPRFKVLQQCHPVKDRKSDTWFPVLYPRGEVIAQDAHHTIFAAKAMFGMFCPIVQELPVTR